MACCTLIFFLCAFYNVSTILLSLQHFLENSRRKKDDCEATSSCFDEAPIPPITVDVTFTGIFYKSINSQASFSFFSILFSSCLYPTLIQNCEIMYSTQFYGFVQKNQTRALGHHDRIRWDIEILECHASFIFHGWFYLIFIPLIIAFRSILLAYLSTSASIPTFILLLGKFNTFV